MQLSDKNKSEFLKTQIIEKYKTKESLRDHFFYHANMVRNLSVVVRKETIGNFLDTYKKLLN
jgi:hypothetical protein